MGKSGKLNLDKVTVVDTSTDDKVSKLTKKSVTDILSNLGDFSTEDQNQIKSVMKKLTDKGRVTSGQGGGSSFDTEEMTEFRTNFDTMSTDRSNGFDTTKNGLKQPYVIDNRGVKRYPMLYFRSVKDLKTKKDKKQGGVIGLLIVNTHKKWVSDSFLTHFFLYLTRVTLHNILKYYTEFKTLDNKTLQVKIITDNITESEILTFTSKLSLTNYIDRLRKNLNTTNVPIVILDNVRNLTFKLNFDTQPISKSNSVEKRVRGDNLRYIPKTMVSVSNTNKTIKTEKLRKIMNYFVKGQITESKLIQELQDLQ